MLPVQRCVAWLAHNVVLAIGPDCAVHMQLETLQAESEAEAAKRAEQDEELRRFGLFPSCHSSSQGNFCFSIALHRVWKVC
jgi:hypothetical protein